MAAKKVIAEIRQDLEAAVGQTIRLRANRGRKKVLERTGVLERTYPNIFVVKLSEQKSSVQRISFSYSDVLTETVELSVINEEGDRRISCEKA